MIVCLLKSIKPPIHTSHVGVAHEAYTRVV
jgi:hypothetical protein